jgi:GT2 family glycosyltransferase
VGVKLIDGAGIPAGVKRVPTPLSLYKNDRALQAISKVKVLENTMQQLSQNETGKLIFWWAFMLMKRDLYQELGFDENCFMYSDDVDLSYRMLLKEIYYYHETTL